VLRDRKAGKWNVQAVVAKADDYKSMLGHTTLQTYMKRGALASGRALCGGALRGCELAAGRPIPISALALRRRR
jgi:hypothetical protein